MYVYSRSSARYDKDVHWLHHRCYMEEHTAHFCFPPYNIFGELMTELCFHRFVCFGCVTICIFGIHHEQCASD